MHLVRNLCCAILLLTPYALSSQVTFWQHLYGGKNNDFGREVLLLDDGTIVMAGESASNDGLGRGLHGTMNDVVISRYATQGFTFWRKVIGGSGEESISQLLKLSTGDLVFIGTTNSKDGDIQYGYGGTDMWVVMLNPQGKIKWSKTYGGSGNDRGISIVEMPGEGLLIGGESGSYNGKMDGKPYGGLDGWIAKIGYDGRIIWKNRYGGTRNEHVSSILQTGPYSFVAALISNSTNGQVKNKIGADDLWLLGLDEYGRIVWQKTYGGKLNESIHGGCVDKQGDLIFAGTSFSPPGGIIPAQKGRGDAWIIKVSPAGQLLQSTTFGGTRADGVTDIQATADGGVVICGTTQSFNGDFRLNMGYYDGYVIKLDLFGNKQWIRNFGYTGQDGLASITETPRGGFLGLGYMQQVGPGEIIPGQSDTIRTPLPRHAGGFDWWLTNFSDPVSRNVKAYVTPPALLGTVIDNEEKSAVNAGITLTDNITLDSLGYSESDAESGRFAMLLPAYGLTSINVLAKGYMFYGEDLFMDTIITKTSIKRTIKLDPIKVGNTLILDKIYFDPGRWELLPASRAELERVIKFLKLNDKVQILISGHTDASGNRLRKVELSENRANAVKKYLEKKGIAPFRLKIKGFGMSKPVASNRTSAGRRRNRRVEFTITAL
ncbi:MAG: OmpA family protein [Bacteroidia bacterium]